MMAELTFEGKEHTVALTDRTGKVTAIELRVRFAAEGNTWHSAEDGGRRPRHLHRSARQTPPLNHGLFLRVKKNQPDYVTLVSGQSILS